MRVVRVLRFWLVGLRGCFFFVVMIWENLIMGRFFLEFGFFLDRRIIRCMGRFCRRLFSFWNKVKFFIIKLILLLF